MVKIDVKITNVALVILVADVIHKNFHEGVGPKDGA
jgi:hypothetical protein